MRGTHFVTRERIAGTHVALATATSARTRSNRIAYIDGLRALAVLIVVASHAWVHSQYGRDGVELFFVLSGFCLSYPTLRKIRDSGAVTFDVHRYAAKRIVRIVPPYWAAIVVLFFVGIVLTDVHHVTILQAVQQGLFDDYHVDFITRVFWSLPVEFRWYFYFPLVLSLWLLSRSTFFYIAALVPLAALALPILDFLEVPAFMMGIVAAHLTINPTRLNRWALPLFLVLLISLCFAAPLPYGKLWDNGFFLIVGAFLGFLIVVATAQHRWLNQIFSNRALVAVGVASYSIYLVHDPVVKGFVRHGFSPWIASAIGIIAGFAFWALFERPFVESALIRDTLISRVLGFLSPVMARIGVRRSLFFERHISHASLKPTLRS